MKKKKSKKASNAETKIKHSPLPWTYCGQERGGCQCMSISAADHPIFDVTKGKWGDSYPAIRLIDPETKEVVQPGYIGAVAEPYMEMMDYGEIPEPLAKANAFFIIKAVNNHYRLVEALEECRAELTNHRKNSDGLLVLPVCACIEAAQEALALAKENP